MPLGFDARAILGYEPLRVTIYNVHGIKTLYNLSQREVNRLINAWSDLLNIQTDRVIITVAGAGCVSKEGKSYE